MEDDTSEIIQTVVSTNTKYLTSIITLKTARFDTFPSSFPSLYFVQGRIRATVLDSLLIYLFKDLTFLPLK